MGVHGQRFGEAYRAWLSGSLAAAHAAGLPNGAFRATVWQIVAASKAGLGEGEELATQYDRIDQFELALAAVRERAGDLSLDITAAKKWLRERGAGKCASVLGRLSSARNQQAHPLAHAFRQLLACVGTCKPGSDLEGESTSGRGDSKGDAEVPGAGAVQRLAAASAQVEQQVKEARKKADEISSLPVSMVVKGKGYMAAGDLKDLVDGAIAVFGGSKGSGGEVEQLEGEPAGWVQAKKICEFTEGCRVWSRKGYGTVQEIFGNGSVDVELDSGGYLGDFGARPGELWLPQG